MNAVIKRSTAAQVERVEVHFPDKGDHYVVEDPDRLVKSREEKEADSPFEVGELITVVSVEDDEAARVVGVDGAGYSKFRVSEDDLLASCRLEPNPEKYLADLIASKMHEIADMKPDMQQIGMGDAKLLTVAVSDTASLTEGALALTNDPAMVKKRLATARNELARFGKQIESKQKELKALLETQKGLLEVRVAEMASIIARFEEGVWTINLYLGKDEEVIRIADGKAAPKDTPITIRQMTLYMDEESAALAESGGISCENVKEFDKWITSNKKHLEQVLPEIKGVVAIKPRRRPKERGSGYGRSLAADMAQWDKKTYFLMRNGEKLYRICPELEVLDVIVPRRDAMDGLFDFVGKDGETKPMRPGGERWMKAMESADATNRHYMRILLFLQGLVDRTVVFQPLPAERLNVFRATEDGEHLRFIRDAEMLLGDGREMYDDWVARINGELAVGHRIIGKFDSYAAARFLKDDEDSRRITPKGATLPRDTEIFTLDARDGDDFVFHFKRTISKYVRGEGYRDVESKTGGACRISPRDTFILNYDRATVDEAVYYLNSRVSRESYAEMMPLLHAFIRTKRAEVKAEEPFKKLLTGQAMQTWELDEEDARRRVDELCLWYKLKNTWHRPLLKDDDRAYQMITAEMESRIKMERRHRQTAGVYATVVSNFKTTDPSLLYVGHRPDGLYVTLSAHNTDDVFVIERQWRVTVRANPIFVTKPGTAVAAKLVDEKRWRVVDGRRHSWFKLWTHPERWAKWRVDVRRGDFLSDDDIASLLTQAGRTIVEDKHRGSPDAKVLYMRRGGYGHEKEYCVCYFVGPGKYPRDLLLSRQAEACGLRLVRATKVKRTGDAVTFDLYVGYETESVSSALQNLKGVRWFNEENVELLRREGKKNARYNNAKSRIEKIATQAYRAWQDHGHKMAEKAALQSWLDDHNEPSLWADEKKHRQFPTPHSRLLDKATEYMAERNFRLVGMTVREIIDGAIVLGMKKIKADDLSWHERQNFEAEDQEKIPWLDYTVKLDAGEKDPFDQPVEVSDGGSDDD